MFLNHSKRVLFSTTVLCFQGNGNFLVMCHLILLSCVTMETISSWSLLHIIILCLLKQQIPGDVLFSTHCPVFPWKQQIPDGMLFSTHCPVSMETANTWWCVVQYPLSCVSMETINTCWCVVQYPLSCVSMETVNT